MKKTIEAALFTVGRPLPVDALTGVTSSSPDAVEGALEALRREYDERETAIEVKRVGEDKYVMQVAPEYADRVRGLAPRELSSPLLRTLSVVAYRQPITQSEVVEIRGNTAYGHVKELSELGLIDAEPHGRTKLLSTTDDFAEYFGLPSGDPEEVREALEDRVEGESLEGMI